MTGKQWSFRLHSFISRKNKIHLTLFHHHACTKSLTFQHLTWWYSPTLPFNFLIHFHTWHPCADASHSFISALLGAALLAISILHQTARLFPRIYALTPLFALRSWTRSQYTVSSLAFRNRQRLLPTAANLLISLLALLRQPLCLHCLNLALTLTLLPATKTPLLKGHRQHPTPLHHHRPPPVGGRPQIGSLQTFTDHLPVNPFLHHSHRHCNRLAKNLRPKSRLTV